MTSVGGMPCAPGSVYNLDSNGDPMQNGTWTANFVCIVPHSIADDSGHSPGRPVVYGHGLLGDAGEVTSDAAARPLPGRTRSCTAPPTRSASPAADVRLGDRSPARTWASSRTLAERTQQGLLNELYLGRLMDNPAGFATSRPSTSTRPPPTTTPTTTSARPTRPTPR